MSASGIETALFALSRRDLLRYEYSDRGQRWSFRHILVRDAAYESLPKAQRADLHERYADHLEAAGDDAGPERLAFVAYHLEQALRYRRELAPHDPGLNALTDRTVEVLEDAASDARDREDLAAAESLLRRGLALDPSDSRLRRRLLVSLFQVFVDQEWVTDMVATVDLLAQAMDDSETELDRAGLETLQGLNDIATAVPVDPEDVARTALRCAELARDAGESRLLVLALSAIVNQHMMAARWERVGEVLAEMAAVGRAYDRRWVRLYEGAVVIYGSTPMSALLDQIAEQRAQGLHTPGEEDRMRLTELVGRAAAAKPGIGAAIRAVETDEDARLVPVYRNTLLGLAHQIHGDVAGAIRCFEETMRIMLEAGDLSHASTQLAWVALLKLERGDALDEVEALVAQAAEVTSPYDILSLALIEAGRGMVEARRGYPDAAHEHLDEATRLCDTSDQAWQQADIRRWAASAAGLRGDHPDERRLLTDALELYRAKEIVHWAGVVEQRLSELG